MALTKKNPPDGRNFITICAEDPNNPGDIYAIAVDPLTGAILVDAAISPPAAPSAIFGNSIALPGTLPSQAVIDGVTIKAKDTNTAAVDVNGFELEAGESIGIAIDDLSKVLVTGTGGDVIFYLGS